MGGLSGRRWDAGAEAGFEAGRWRTGRRFAFGEEEDEGVQGQGGDQG